MEFSEALEAEKARLGCSQERMAEILELSLRVVIYYLKGERTPPAVMQEGILARLKAAAPAGKTTRAKTK